ncbi:MAG: amino acid ABC transporter substrate-binding protein [Christensenellales bacterium]|jgi:polar amino acid transport system substrate-binding protein
MKKILVAVLALLLVLSFAACSSNIASPVTSVITEPDVSDDTQNTEPEETDAIEESDLSWQAVEDKGSFVLGFDETFAPMGFKDENGVHVGFDIELAKEVAARLNIEVVLQPVDWDAKVMELNNGNIDMIWNGLTITEERKQEMLFSDPYMNNRQMIVVLADSGIATKADLEGKTVAAQIDSSAMAAIEAEPDVMDTFGELIQSPDYVEALMELKQGSVDAVVIDETMGRYYIGADDNPDIFAILKDSFGEEQYGIGFRKGDTALRNKIQEALDSIIADGTAAEISAKWFADNVLISD